MSRHLRDRHGRPRIVSFLCPKCGRDALVCRSTGRQGELTVRYYKCTACGHRGVLVQGGQYTWWKNTNCGNRSQSCARACTIPEKYRHLALFQCCM